MKKFITSMVLLAVILFSGVLSTRYIKASSESLSDIIENTLEQVNTGSWETAKDSLDDFEKKWDKTEKAWGVLIDHFEMDNIEAAMIKSQKYIDTKDSALSLAELNNLKFMVGHIYKKEEFNLVNIF